MFKLVESGIKRFVAQFDARIQTKIEDMDNNTAVNMLTAVVVQELYGVNKPVKRTRRKRKTAQQPAEK